MNPAVPAVLQLSCLVLLGLAALASHAAGTPRTLVLGEGQEIPVEVHPASGEGEILVWLPSEHGLPDPLRRLAGGIAAAGLEVWLADLLAANFLPVQASSLDAVPPQQVARLIEAVIRRRPGRRLYLVASGRGAIVALRGARAWQAAHPGQAALAGAILLHPNLYVETPEPGREARYLPIAGATSLPVFVLQPARSPWRWRLDTLARTLGRGGAPVYVRRLPEVRDRFHFRPDATAMETATAAGLPRVLLHAARLLATHPGPHAAAPLAGTGRSGRLKKAARLRSLAAAAPPALRLPRLGGGEVDLASFKGRVVLVNFWASWCPPCVHEMPSMERLRRRLAERPFTILAVNMAEDGNTIRRFLDHKVQVDFTILMDRDGQALRRWKVFAFPTSYVVDKQGRLRYGLFGAIDWEREDVVAAIEALLAE